MGQNIKKFHFLRKEKCERWSSLKDSDTGILIGEKHFTFKLAINHFSI